MKKFLLLALMLTASAVAFAQNPIAYLPEQSMAACYLNLTAFKGTAIERLVRTMLEQEPLKANLQGIDCDGQIALAAYPSSTKPIRLNSSEEQEIEYPEVHFVECCVSPGQAQKICDLNENLVKTLRQQIKDMGEIAEGVQISTEKKTIDGMPAWEQSFTMEDQLFIRTVDVLQSPDMIQSFAVVSGKPIKSFPVALRAPDGQCALLTPDMLQDTAFALAFDCKSILAMFEIPEEEKNDETYQKLSGLDKVVLMMKIKDNMATFMLMVDCRDAKICNDFKMEIATQLAPLQESADPQDPFASILKSIKVTPRGDKSFDVSAQVSMDLINLGIGMLQMAIDNAAGQNGCGMEMDMECGEIMEAAPASEPAAPASEPAAPATTK